LTTSPSRETRYNVKNLDGELVAIKYRIDYADGTKQTPWSRPGFEGYGLHGLKVNELPLFQTEYLKGVDSKHYVFVVEGEKAAARLHDPNAGLYAVGTYGASHRPTIQSLRPLSGHPVILWPDNDEPGKEHMTRIGYDLLALTFPVTMVTPDPDWPKGYDAYDFLEEGHILRELYPRLNDAPSRPAVYKPDRYEPSSPAPGQQDFYDRIKTAYDLRDYVSSHGVELKPRGDRLHGSCPLPGHEDSTPSFVVYPETRSWYCYGCRKGGDVIDFAEEMGLDIA